MYIPLYSTSLNFIFDSAELILPIEYAALRGNRMADIQNIYPRFCFQKRNGSKSAKLMLLGKK
jgi:hypothetical protein